MVDEKVLKQYFRMNEIQLAKAREAKPRMAFPDPITEAIYLKTLAQAQNGFTLLEMVVSECSAPTKEKIYSALISSGAIIVKGSSDGDVDM